MAIKMDWNRPEKLEHAKVLPLLQLSAIRLGSFQCFYCPNPKGVPFWDDFFCCFSAAPSCEDPKQLCLESTCQGFQFWIFFGILRFLPMKQKGLKSKHLFQTPMDLNQACGDTQQNRFKHHQKAHAVGCRYIYIYLFFTYFYL